MAAAGAQLSHPLSFSFSMHLPLRGALRVQSGGKKRELESSKHVVASISPVLLHSCTWNGVCRVCDEEVVLYLSMSGHQDMVREIICPWHPFREVQTGLLMWIEWQY